MKPANERVANYLKQFGIAFDIHLLSAAVRTARLAAEALDCEVGQIANSLIFREVTNDGTADRAVLIMCSGDRRVDLIRSSSFDPGTGNGSFVHTMWCTRTVRWSPLWHRRD